MARKKQNENLPTYDELMVPIVKALIDLGGSGSIEEINSKVYEIANIDDSILQIPHNEDTSRNEVDYRLAWSRTYLKKFGLLENSSRGIWALSGIDFDVNSIQPSEIVRKVREQEKNSNNEKNTELLARGDLEQELDFEVSQIEGWKENLINILYNISPAAFERLAQRILRESGFSQVEVTGKAGDGGIDGKGIVRISGLLSFHVIFQCKRYRGSVTPSQIRDFRGAMQGRATKV